MPIDSLHVAGYRSIREIRLALGQTNVLTGPNGCGKSNMYQAMVLLAAAANGTLARTFALEGGLPSALWAGPRRKHSKKEPVRMVFSVRLRGMEYGLQCGIVPPGKGFYLDPEVKYESLRVLEGGNICVMERRGSSAWVRNSEGERISFPFDLSESESILSQLQDPHLYPHLSIVSQELRRWRFYHHFSTEPDAPQRRPQVGVRTPVLDPQGHDLAAVLATIQMTDGHSLNQAIETAFPGARLDISGERGRFVVELQMPGIMRPFEARELSDGTLRYLCLLAALLSPQPPTVLALNEPETSLHPDLLEPLAKLIEQASKHSQMWITTHSLSLAKAIERSSGQKRIRLHKVEGETRIIGQNSLSEIHDPEA